jgi:UDP-N-acetylmuramoyl-L-alanyl-D-glutamate--2,6-diaminopimelate ligase
MQLGQLLPQSAENDRTVEISALAYDNRRVGPGTLFFCVRGFTRDGHDFAEDAVGRGAAALVVDHYLKRLAVPQVLVADVRAAMATAAVAFYGDPTATLPIAGVTGTNGKTTTAHLLRALLEGAGVQAGLLGTVTCVVAGAEREVQRTTPEAIDLQQTFREMLDGGDRACVMEVSSHALSLARVDGTRFAAAIFTNLTQDHLDFHPTMEDYFVAKRRLFTEHSPAHAVINVDDRYGRRLAAELDQPTTYALDDAGATFRALEVETDLAGSRFVVLTPDGEREVSSPLRGRFNVYNVLAAIATSHAMGVALDDALGTIERAGQVPGRFETIAEGQPFAVIVDYAHTPDSLENVLAAARRLTDGRLHVVFGCGGDRDRGKRPLMGEIAARLADRVIVTSDNPRSEDPDAIIAEILAGIERQVEHDPDRRAAIHDAIETADPGDVVVIAGKGHEQGQEFEAGRKLPFDDATVARDALRARPGARVPSTGT